MKDYKVYDDEGNHVATIHGKKKVEDPNWGPLIVLFAVTIFLSLMFKIYDWIAGLF